MNSCPPAVLDSWLAFYLLETQETESEMKDPHEINKQLAARQTKVSSNG